MIVLCIGPYTKLVTYLTASDKTYKGAFAFGVETATDDREGDELSYCDPGTLSLETIREAAKAYVGEIQQVPPRFAAVKIAGKKLYEYARKGQEVVPDPRLVHVYSLEILSALPAEIRTRAGQERKILRVEFSCRVSSGTYVRAFARDLGRDLKCGGHLLELQRTAVGKFAERNAMTYEELRDQPGTADRYILRGKDSLDSDKYPILPILPAYVDRALRGQPLLDKMLQDPAGAANLAAGVICGITAEDGRLLAMAQAERFDETMNVYGSRFAVHFKSVRVFPGGLK